MVDHDTLFDNAGGFLNQTTLYPQIEPDTLQTKAGTRYLQSPGVVMMDAPYLVSTGPLKHFLDGFNRELYFDQYIYDPMHDLNAGGLLAKMAGQMCYLSFGPTRTYNVNADRYLTNIKEQRHGSVLEHVHYSFLLYGVSRSCVMELIRHRAGTAFSQVSQRYVGPLTLRFVERPEFARSQKLHELFERRIDGSADAHSDLIDALQTHYDLMASINAHPEKLGLQRIETLSRKELQQQARADLSNEVEAPMIFSVNARAARHIIEMRASAHAEPEIRRLAFYLWLCLMQQDPLIFNDFVPEQQKDSSWTLKTPYPAV